MKKPTTKSKSKAKFKPGDNCIPKNPAPGDVFDLGDVEKRAKNKGWLGTGYVPEHDMKERVNKLLRQQQSVQRAHTAAPKVQIEVLKFENNMKAAALDVLRKENGTLRARNEAGVLDVLRLGKETKTLQFENAALKEHIEALKLDNTGLREKHWPLRREVEELKKGNEALKREGPDMRHVTMLLDMLAEARGEG